MKRILILFALPLFAINLEHGIDLLRRGKFQEARHFFERATVVEPGNPVNYLYLGYAFLGLKMPDSAEFYALKGLQFAPESKELTFLEISALVQQENYEKALRIAENFYERSGKDSLAQVALGQVYFNYAGNLYRAGEKRRAIDFYKKVLKLVPDFPATYTNLVVIYLELDQVDSAKKYVDLGMEKFPGNPDILKARAQLYAKENDLKELKNTLGMLTAVDPSDVQIWLKLALVYRATGQMDSAIYIYEKLLKEFPDEKEVYTDYAQIYEGIFDYKKAREIYLKYLKNHPGDQEFIRKVAETYEGESDYEHAIDFYKKLTDSDEKVAELLVKMGKKREAFQIYKRLIKRNPLIEEYWINASQLIDSEDSLFSFLNEMQKYFPSSPYPCAEKGKILLKRGENAEECLRRAVGAGSDDPEVYFNLAKLYFEQGDKVKGTLTVKIAFRKLTSTIANLQKVFSGNQSLFELKKHEKEVKRIKTTNDYLRKMLDLLKNNVDEQDYEKFVKDLYRRYPTSFLVLESLTQFYFEKNDLDSALIFATQLVELNPDDGKNHFLRGRILKKMGRINEALLEYRKALAGGLEDYEFAKEYLETASFAGKKQEAIEDLRRIEKPEIQKLIESPVSE